MLERLMSADPYKRHPETNKFNERYIIQLVRNYRSHPVILTVPNDLFYDGVLLPQADKGTPISNFIPVHYYLICLSLNAHRCTSQLSNLLHNQLKRTPIGSSNQNFFRAPTSQWFSIRLRVKLRKKVQRPGE